LQNILIQYPSAKTGNYTTPGSVTIIGNWAFSSCSRLTSVTISNSVTTIGEFAFENCSGLTSITIGNSVTYIGRSAFSDCKDLTTVNFNATNCTTIEYDYPFHIFSNCPSFSTLIMGDGVEIIPDSAFYRCSSLTSVTMPNSLTTVGDYAFCFCDGITSITIPNSVTTIGQRAFSRCRGLTTLVIGNSVTMIGLGAFFACSGLTEMYIKAVNPPEIFSHTFGNVDKSIPVYVCGSAEDYRKANYWSEFTNIIEDDNCNTNIEKLSLTSSITIYPNPTRDNIHITLPENVHQAVFSLYDMQGKILLQQEISNQDAVQVSHLAAGIYIYNVTTEKQNYRGEFVISD
jgi:hypothetical protein